MEINTLAINVYDRHQVVIVVNYRRMAGDLGGQISSGYLALVNRQVSHLWAAEVHTVAGGVHSIQSDDFHVPVYIDVVVPTGNTEPRGRARAPEGWK